MQTSRYLRELNQAFFKNWRAYMTLIIGVSVVTALIVVPLLRWGTEGLMALGHIPYISYDNLGTIFKEQPLIFLALILLALIILLLAYLQFALLLGGVENQRLAQGKRLTQVLGEAIRDLRHIRLGSIGFFCVYFILIIPFAGTVLGSSLLAKITIPQFIVAFISQKPLFAGLLVIFYLIVGYIGLRLIRVLPIAVLQDQPLRQAAKQSLRETRGRFWQYFWRIVWLTLIVTVLAWGWSAVLIALQKVLDQTSIALPGAMLTMTLLELGKLVITTWSAGMYLLLLVLPEGVRHFTFRQPRLYNKKKHRWAKILLGLGLCAGTALLLTYNYAYMKGLLIETPLTISHRGVDNGNGVQNTIPALRQTAKEHPDYVEMDIHETKDKQFVVMHDENLKALTGVAARLRQMTLSQLTKLYASENGHQAKVASFDAYLKAAEQLHQKLIVELKTTDQDSADSLNRFIAKYGNRLIKDRYRVHSLNFTAVTRLKAQMPKLYVSFIVPYSLVLPHSDANAYTMEETTLDPSMISQAAMAGQQIWAWTVNSEDDMLDMLFMNTDGIITDQLALLQKTIRQQTDQPSYATRLQIFSNTLDSLRPNETISN